MPRLPLLSDVALLNAKNKRTPLGPDSAGKSHVPYVANDATATPVGAFHYYASGRLAVFENRMYAGNYYWVYADNDRNTVLCQFDPLGQGHACFPNGKLRLTSTKAGGTFLDEHGSVLKSWTDKQPLKGDAISFALNSIATFTFKSRYDVKLGVALGGREYSFQLGEQLVHGTGNYVSKAVGQHKLGPERGKYILDVSLIDREKGKPGAVGMSKKTRVTVEDISIAALHPVVLQAEDMRARVQGMLAQPWIESTVMPSRNFDKTGNPLDFQKSMDDPQWASFLGHTPPSNYAQLRVSRVLQNASGRYRQGMGTKSARVKLPVIQPRDFDDYITVGVPQDTVVVVCCLASWLPISNRIEQWLESLNGELVAEKKPLGTPQGFILRKFDMSASRLLRDRYNINTIPMYLMYYAGKLAYASNVLNGYGSSKEDMRTQVAATFAAAQGGQFLPRDFRFGKTDNRLMEDITKTLSYVSTEAGAGVGTDTSPPQPVAVGTMRS